MLIFVTTKKATVSLTESPLTMVTTFSSVLGQRLYLIKGHGGKHAVSMHRPFVSSSIACTAFGVFKDMPKGYLCGHFALDDVKFGC